MAVKTTRTGETGREPTVRIRLPLAEDNGDGLRADQNEQVILNGKSWNIRRGEWVDLPVALFPLLRERYGDI